MMRMLTLIICLLVSLGSAEYVGTKGYTWSQNVPGSVELTTDRGFKIAGTVRNADIDIESGYYALISSDDGREEDGIRFSYSVPTNYRFLIGTSTATAELVSGGEIEIFFERAGDEPPTTTPATTTDVPLPTPATNESKSIIVYLAGHAARDYSQIDLLTSLRTSILGMAEEYCSTNDIDATGISIKNVVINRLTSCPDSWHDWETCAEMMFSVPIYSDADRDYQLSAAHLRIMWDTLADKYLEKFTVYNEPNVKALNTIWYVAVSIIVVALVVLLVAMRWAVLKFVRIFKKWDYFESDSSQDFSDNPKYDVPKNNFEPHYDQETVEDEEEWISFDNPAYDKSEDA